MALSFSLPIDPLGRLATQTTPPESALATRTGPRGDLSSCGPTRRLGRRVWLLYLEPPTTPMARLERQGEHRFHIP